MPDFSLEAIAHQLASADHGLFVGRGLAIFCASDLVDAVDAIHAIRSHSAPRSTVRPAARKAVAEQARQRVSVEKLSRADRRERLTFVKTEK